MKNILICLFLLIDLIMIFISLMNALNKVEDKVIDIIAIFLTIVVIILICST